MKRIGFTLAEVLITLAIIGVVAAITLPSLMTDTTSAQIGPKLAKAVSMFEQANEALLNANSVDTLTDAGFANKEDTLSAYAVELSRHLKGVANNKTFLTKDGMKYSFAVTMLPENTSVPGHLQRIGDVTVDINGDSKPNIDGTDIFYFSWWNDGSLRPKGATNWGGYLGEVTETVEGEEVKVNKYMDGEVTWTSKCPRAENGAVKDYSYCAGHVFENNFKVLYR